jgi:hypothetical protein
MGNIMSKVFGTSALLCAVLAIFIPTASIQASGVAIVLAVFSAFMGDRVLASTTSAAVAINGLFLSFPISTVLQTRGPYQTGFIAALLIAFLAPFAAMLMGAMLNKHHP